jgi:hypothetical protein
VVFAEKLEPGEHAFTIDATYRVPEDAESGRIIWLSFDIPLVPHTGWVVGLPAAAGE